jgi:predicted membrane-bound spermidine synthase
MEQVMEYSISDFLGNIGVFLIILGYLLLQLERIRSTDLVYSLLNLIGAVLIIISLMQEFNLSAFVIEVFWVIISFIGIIRFLTQNSRLRDT